MKHHHPDLSPPAYAHPDPMVDAALDWALRLTAAANPSDLADVEAQLSIWLAEDPRHAAAYARVSALASLPELELATRRLTMEPHPNEEQRRTVRSGGQRRSFLRRHPRRTAMAALAACVALVIGLQVYPTLLVNLQADYSTSAGEARTVRLPDGSDMVLNTDSAVALDFAAGRRSVRLLKGEAFFSVVKDADRTFTVAGHFLEVSVKGTGFAVKSDEEEDRVILQHGHISVAPLPQRGENVELVPGEAISATARGLQPVTRNQTSDALAWLEGRIIFEDKPLRAVMNELGRYYPAPIILTTERIAGKVVSGNYRLSDPQGNIRSLAAAVGARVTRLPGGSLILY